MSNTLDDIVARLQGRSIMNGWGAMAIFSRTRLNRVLEQRFAEQNNEYRFLPRISLTVPIGNNQTIHLTNILLGAPVLSFETANLRSSAVTLTLNILGGTFVDIQHIIGQPSKLRGVYQIKEPQGHRLTMEVGLHVATGNVDSRGRILLDLSKGTDYKCTLAGEDALASQLIGVAFQTYFQSDALANPCKVYELGSLDLRGYNALTPYAFKLLTQPAPGATLRNTPSWGDGAVVVFLQLRANEAPGSLPIDLANWGSFEPFPYLIPDNKNDDGSDMYSATLLIEQALAGYATEAHIDVISSVLFPGERVFEPGEVREPYDKVWFGNLVEDPDTYRIEPLTATLVPGATQPFKVTNASGDSPSGLTWETRCQSSRSADGTLRVNGNQAVFTPSELSAMDRQNLRHLVTARWSDAAGQQHEASAVALVASEALAVTPMVAEREPGVSTGPTVFKVVSLEGTDAPYWDLENGSLGSLNVAPDRMSAEYTPPQTMDGAPLHLDRIALSTPGGARVYATVVLSTTPKQLSVSPEFKDDVTELGEVAVVSDIGNWPAEAVNWTVYGEGSVRPDGGSCTFVAPADSTFGLSVVRCDVTVEPFGELASGYSIIRHVKLAPEQHWENVSEFTIKAWGSGTGYANGHQQTQLQIDITVTPEDQSLSDEELATLTLYDASGVEVPSIAEEFGEEGISNGAHWAFARRRNRFDLPVSNNSLAPVPAQEPAQLPGNQRRKLLYMLSTSQESTEFVASFTAWNGITYTSNRQHTDGSVRLELRAPPGFDASSYGLRPSRAVGGGATDGPGGSFDFVFNLVTTDIYRLEYPPEAPVQIPFRTCELLPSAGQQPGLASLCMWEDEGELEVMFSCTGFAFDSGEGRNLTVNYDPAVLDLYTQHGLARPTEIVPGDKPLLPGQPLFVLNRVDNMPYASNRTQRSPVRMRLRDARGNQHDIYLTFKNSSRHELAVNE